MVQSIYFLRKQDVLKRLGVSKSTFYLRVKAGLFIKPVSLGRKAVAWPEHEVDQVLASLVAGNSESEIKILVKQITENRKKFLLPLSA